MKERWDWSLGEKEILDLDSWKPDVLSVDELTFSPDGEKIATRLLYPQGEYGLAVNGYTWEQAFDNIWYLRFSPECELCALTSSMGMWTLNTDKGPWPGEYEYIWDTRFDLKGDCIATAIKKDGYYGMAVNGTDWEELYPYATDFTITSAGGGTACVVQTESMDEADIQTFRKGIFTVAVNGKPWKTSFMNVWNPCFNLSGNQTAASVRLNHHEYTIAVNGKAWDKTFDCVWEPGFHPLDNSILAPVQKDKIWQLARDGEIIWDNKYLQLWHVLTGQNGENVWAIGAEKFGKFTVVKNDKSWKHKYPVITDLVISPDGENACAIGQNGAKRFPRDTQLGDQMWQLIVNDIPVSGFHNRIFTPVFSPDNEHVAAVCEDNGKYTVLLDGNPYQEDFSLAWDPVFSPDGKRLLIRGFKDNKFTRTVVSTRSFLD